MPAPAAAPGPGAVLTSAACFVESVETSGIGSTFWLSPPMAFNGVDMSHAKITSRSKRGSRISLGLCEAMDNRTTCEVRHQDLQPDAAANDMLQLFNACWARAGITVDGVQVFTRPYLLQRLSAAAGLVEVVPGAVSLGELKRRFRKGDPSLRVADYLAYDEEKLGRLAASTAGFLASNYLLGAAGGDGDNLMLTSEGDLYRVDFSYLFGNRPSIDAPVVWLPRAITAALGDRWQAVQQAAKAALRSALALCLPRPPANICDLQHWAQTQASLLRAERELGAPASRYLESLTESDFEAALRHADNTLGKKVKTFLHDAFGFRSKLQYQQATTPSAARASPGDAQRSGYSVPERLFMLVEVETWRVAMCVIACLCCDDDVGSHTLHLLLWSLLSAAADHEEDALQDHAVLVVSRIFGRSASVAQSWLACFARSSFHVECMDAIALHLRSPLGLSEGAVFDSKEVSPMLGLLCAAVRLGIAAGARLSGGPPLSVAPSKALRRGGCTSGGGHLQPIDNAVFWCNSGTLEELVARRGAVRAVMALLEEEDTMMRHLVFKLVEKMSPEEFVDASRYIHSDEQLALLRAVERLIKDATVGPAVRAWARQCVSSLARDDCADGSLKRAAICTIACSVHDEEQEVRVWARDFLTEADGDVQGDELNAAARNPVCAVLRMAKETTFASSCEALQPRLAASSPMVTAVGPLILGEDPCFTQTSAGQAQKSQALIGLGLCALDLPADDDMEPTEAPRSECGSATTPSTTSSWVDA